MRLIRRFSQGFKLRGRTYSTGRAARRLENFFVGDPIEGAINLQVVAETAYTNPIFVAMTEVAAINGDQATPSVFLRHPVGRSAAHGEGTRRFAAARLSNPDNLKFLQQDFDERSGGSTRSSIRSSAPSTTTSRSSARRATARSGRSGSRGLGRRYIEKLAPFGLKVPRWYPDAYERHEVGPHTAAMFAFASWPLQFWRFDPLTGPRHGVFEKKYPAGTATMARSGTEYRKMIDPKNKSVPLCAVPALAAALPRLSDALCVPSPRHLDDGA